MSDRDELANAVGVALANAYDDDAAVTVEEPVADALWAAGWRKKPSREAVARAVALGLDGWNDYDAASEDYKRELLSGADAILALMDGPTETGDGDVG